MGKKIAKTGVSIVPNPKPEKKVSREVMSAAKQIMMISVI
jgi:hypothetical protein